MRGREAVEGVVADAREVEGCAGFEEVVPELRAVGRGEDDLEAVRGFLDDRAGGGEVDGLEEFAGAGADEADGGVGGGAVVDGDRDVGEGGDAAGGVLAAG